jgi:hypothetical protein
MKRIHDLSLAFLGGRGGIFLRECVVCAESGQKVEKISFTKLS